MTVSLEFVNYVSKNIESPQGGNKKIYGVLPYVALKCLHNSQDITVEFLREIRYFPIILVILTFQLMLN